MTTDGYIVSTDKSLLNIDLIHDYLSNHSYWAKNRSREAVEKSIAHSICFAVLDAQGAQVGFARVVSDRTIYGYIMDVFIIEAARGKGLGKLLMREILENEDLKTVWKWTLATLDAHGLYEQFGFKITAQPERWMERIGVKSSIK